MLSEWQSCRLMLFIGDDLRKAVDRKVNIVIYGDMHDPQKHLGWNAVTPAPLFNAATRNVERVGHCLLRAESTSDVRYGFHE